ncbi:MAG: phytanoyl-CoA dioxygenase family protein [Pirellulaceae bacterium]
MMTRQLTQAPQEQLRQAGYTMLSRVFDEAEVVRLGQRLQESLEQQAATAESPVLQSRGQTYGARNLLQAFPEAVQLARHAALCELLRETLGGEVGLVRGLFFDKPPDRSWSLPWHRDQTIAVEQNDLPSEHFRKPTRKAGVAHVEAPRSLLERMVTLRIHLDAMTDENGPLAVMPGSHLGDDAAQASPVTLKAQAGDVLAMRPLLLHSSGMSQQGAMSHRRVIHLEFAADRELPDGYAWHTFLPIAG